MGECFHELEHALAARWAASGTRLPKLWLVRCSLPDGSEGLSMPYIEELGC